jgi:hypothetical protein
MSLRLLASVHAHSHLHTKTNLSAQEKLCVHACDFYCPTKSVKTSKESTAPRSQTLKTCKRVSEQHLCQQQQHVASSSNNNTSTAASTNKLQPHTCTTLSSSGRGRGRIAKYSHFLKLKTDFDISAIAKDEDSPKVN